MEQAMKAEKIKGKVLEMGAGAVAIAPAVALEGVASTMRELEKLGYFGTMGWLGRTIAKRTSPNIHLEGAKSILCSAWGYRSDLDGSPFARFAQHVDYHSYIEERLRSAWENSETTGFNAKFFVDSKPLSEKRYSEMAGLGWIGKNTLLMNEKMGSYFCVGLILTDMELDHDTPQENRCGSCQKCVDACPTGALERPYILNASRCISYLTIEHKGEIGSELKTLIGQQKYGCDICQEVCPFNRDILSEPSLSLK